MSELRSRWQPPAGFQELPSAVEGVRVFAPGPDPSQDEPEGPVVFRCPNCGAATAYDIAAGGVACRFCGHVAQASGQRVGLQAARQEFTLDSLRQREDGWGVARRALVCGSCGGEVSLADGALSETCPFCASNQVDLRDATTRLRPGFLIPFSQQPADLVEPVARWLGSGWIHPADLQRGAAVENFTPIYLPYWLFGAELDMDWRAEVGTERTEWYTDSDGHSRSRTVIDWRWASGSPRRRFPDLPVPATSKVSARVLGRLRDFDFSALREYEAGFLAGFQAVGFDIELAEGWRTGRAALREAGKDYCYSTIPEHHVRNFELRCDLEDESWRYILLPLYVSAYRYRDRSYVVLVNGQTGGVDGQRPVAWWRVYLAMTAAVTPGLGLALCLGVPLTFVGGLGIIFLLLGAAVLMVGVRWSRGLYQRATESELG